MRHVAIVLLTLHATCCYCPINITLHYIRHVAIVLFTLHPTCCQCPINITCTMLALSYSERRINGLTKHNSSVLTVSQMVLQRLNCKEMDCSVTKEIITPLFMINVSQFAGKCHPFFCIFH